MKDDSQFKQEKREEEKLVYCFVENENGTLTLQNLLKDPTKVSRCLAAATDDGHSTLSYAEALLAPRRSTAQTLKRMGERRLHRVVLGVFAAAEDRYGIGWRGRTNNELLRRLYQMMAGEIAAATTGHSTWSASDIGKPHRMGSNKLPALEAKEISAWLAEGFPGRDGHRRLRAEGVALALVCCWRQRIDGTKDVHWSARESRAVRKALRVDESVLLYEDEFNREDDA